MTNLPLYCRLLCFYEFPEYPTRVLISLCIWFILKFTLKPSEFQSTFSVARPQGQRSRRPAFFTQLCHYKLYHTVQTTSHLWLLVSSSVQWSGWTSWSFFEWWILGGGIGFHGEFNVKAVVECSCQAILKVLVITAGVLLKKAVNTELQVKLFKSDDLPHTHIQKLYKVQYIGISFPTGYIWCL